MRHLLTTATIAGTVLAVATPAMADLVCKPLNAGCFQIDPVPEPGSLTLLAAGLVLLAAWSLICRLRQHAKILPTGI